MFEYMKGGIGSPTSDVSSQNSFNEKESVEEEFVSVMDRRPKPLNLAVRASKTGLFMVPARPNKPFLYNQWNPADYVTARDYTMGVYNIFITLHPINQRQNDWTRYAFKNLKMEFEPLRGDYTIKSTQLRLKQTKAKGKFPAQFYVIKKKDEKLMRLKLAKGLFRAFVSHLCTCGTCIPTDVAVVAFMCLIGRKEVMKEEIHYRLDNDLPTKLSSCACKCVISMFGDCVRTMLDQWQMECATIAKQYR